MAEKIEVKIDKANLQLKTIEGKLKASGEIVLSFNCEKCNKLCKPNFRYDGGKSTRLNLNEESQEPYNCESCGESYLIGNQILIRTDLNTLRETKLDNEINYK